MTGPGPAYSIASNKVVALELLAVPLAVTQVEVLVKILHEVQVNLQLQRLQQRLTQQ